MIHLEAVYTGLSRGSRKGKLCRRVENDVPMSRQRNRSATDSPAMPLVLSALDAARAPTALSATGR